MTTTTFGNIRFIHGDNMDFMRGLPDKAFSLAIVDPEYGIGASNKYFIRQGKQTGKSLAASGLNYVAKDWDNQSSSQEYFNELLRVSKNQIVWGANHFISKLPYDSSCWIVWDKDNSENLYADCELAWTSFSTAVRKIRFKWHGMLQENMKNKEERIHPTQKPVRLYDFLLKNYAKPGDTILDTHLGSGSSAIAAYRLGFAFTGIELDKDYYDASVARFRKELLQTSWLVPQVEEDKPVQKGLF